MYYVVALCVGGLLAFFLVFLALEKKWYKPVYAAGIYLGCYVLLRLLGYYSWTIWVDVLAWACLLTVVLAPGLIVFHKRYVLGAIVTVVWVLISLFALLLNGLFTERYWMWDNSRRFIADTPHGNLVVLEGSDAGGLSYTQYALRSEVFWGIVFKEHDAQRIYEGEPACQIWLGEAGAQVHYDACKKQVIAVE